MTSHPVIQSVQNPRFRHWVRIVKRGRTPEGAVVLPVEGPKLLAEALTGGWRPALVAYTQRGLDAGTFNPNSPAFAGAEALLLAPHVFAKLTETVTPQEPFVLARPPDWGRLVEPAGDAAGGMRGAVKRRTADRSDESDPSPEAAERGLFLGGVSRLVVADGVQDPGNLGTILRSARAFGFNTVATTPGSAGVASAKVLRASAGALFRCRVFAAVPAHELARQLVEGGFLIVVLDPRGEVPIEEIDWREPLAIVTGGEAAGPSGIWVDGRKSSGVWSVARGENPTGPGEVVRARIPMAPGCESLNTATAAALAFHAAARALSLF